MAALHSVDTFMKGPGILNAEHSAKAGEITMTFENVKPDTYAIMVIHDSNDNKRMDREANGMAKEHYGMTGDSMIMEPPNFDAAKFEVTSEDLAFSIRF